MVKVELLWLGNRERVALVRDWEWAHNIAEGMIYALGWEPRSQHNYGGAYSYIVYDPFGEMELELLLSPAE